MNYKKIKQKKFSFAILSLACLFDSSFAAKQIDLSKQPFPTSAVTQGYRMAPGLPETPLQITKSHTDTNQITHVRVQQMHANIPVWGADSVIHLPSKLAHGFMMNKNSNGLIGLITKDSTIKKNGFFYAEIDKDIGHTLPEKFLQPTNHTAAINTLKQQFTDIHKENTWHYANEKAELIVYVDQQSKSHWAYKVSFIATAAKKLPKQPYAIIDAETHKIYTAWNNVKQFGSDTAANATGYGGNPVLGQWAYGKDKPALMINRLAEENKCFMENEEVAVLEKDDTELEHPGIVYNFPCTKLTDQQKDFRVPEQGFYGSSNGAYSPINDALHYGSVIKNMYKEWYGVEVLTQPDSNLPLKLKMNILTFGDFENAAWASESQQMYFGLGGQDLYPLITLGIAAHEISHGFTDQHSNLVYKDESGAINEAFSDMVISAVSYYHSKEKETDWSTGWEVLKTNEGKDKSQFSSVRYFDKPSRDRFSIDHVQNQSKVEKLCERVSKGDPDEYQNCFVHLASGIFNKAFYELATTPGWNARLAFEVMIKANQDYWTATSDFQSAACGIKNAALDLSKKNPVIEIKAIENAFEAVGISVASC